MIDKNKELIIFAIIGIAAIVLLIIVTLPEDISIAVPTAVAVAAKSLWEAFIKLVPIFLEFFAGMKSKIPA